MSAGLVVQWTVVAIAVVASVVHLVQLQAPRLGPKLRRRLAIVLLRPARGRLLRRLGRRLAPAPSVRMPATPCGGCAGRRDCAPADAPPHA
ncbi:MAG: DUF6587 family protein [Pseudomonadota bacterium]|jgi:hypothetical protein